MKKTAVFIYYYLYGSVTNCLTKAGKILFICINYWEGRKAILNVIAVLAILVLFIWSILSFYLNQIILQFDFLTYKSALMHFIKKTVVCTVRETVVCT